MVQENSKMIAHVKLRNQSKWDLVMDFSVTLVILLLVCGHIGTLCISKGTKCQVIAQLLVKIFILLQNCTKFLRTDFLLKLYL